MPDHFTETFDDHACNGILDLFIGYDNRPLAESSRDMTTFQTPFGTYRLTTLPMKWTNSVPVFHEDVIYILQPKIPDTTISYIDNVPIQGPATDYRLPNGDFEHIPEHSLIQRFVRKHFDSLNCVVTRMHYSGGTFSGKKSIFITQKYSVLGYRCTPAG